MSGISVRPYTAADQEWVAAMLAEEVGGRWQARRGEMVDVLGFRGLVAEQNEERVGYLSYRPDGKDCEVVAIAATRRFAGIGTALLQKLTQQLNSGTRVWLVTTNDNLEALRFYQRRGFKLRELRAGAVDEARRTLKPTIRTTGAFGIPIRDELELEARVDGLSL